MSEAQKPDSRFKDEAQALQHAFREYLSVHDISGRMSGWDLDDMAADLVRVAQANRQEREAPQRRLTEDQVMEAIRPYRSLDGRVALTCESGPYGVTRPTNVAMVFAHAIEVALVIKGELDES